MSSTDNSHMTTCTGTGNARTHARSPSVDVRMDMHPSECGDSLGEVILDVSGGILSTCNTADAHFNSLFELMVEDTGPAIPNSLSNGLETTSGGGKMILASSPDKYYLGNSHWLDEQDCHDHRLSPHLHHFDHNHHDHNRSWNELNHSSQQEQPNMYNNNSSLIRGQQQQAEDFSSANSNTTTTFNTTNNCNNTTTTATVTSSKCTGGSSAGQHTIIDHSGSANAAPSFSSSGPGPSSATTSGVHDHVVDSTCINHGATNINTTNAPTNTTTTSDDATTSMVHPQSLSSNSSPNSELAAATTSMELAFCRDSLHLKNTIGSNSSSTAAPRGAPTSTGTSTGTDTGQQQHPFSCSPSPSVFQRYASNLDDDQYARSREEAWPRLVRAAWTKTPAPSGSMQQVAQILDRYKAVSDQSLPTQEQEEQQQEQQKQLQTISQRPPLVLHQSNSTDHLAQTCNNTPNHHNVNNNLHPLHQQYLHPLSKDQQDKNPLHIQKLRRTRSIPHLKTHSAIQIPFRHLKRPSSSNFNGISTSIQNIPEEPFTDSDLPTNNNKSTVSAAPTTPRIPYTTISSPHLASTISSLDSRSVSLAQRHILTRRKSRDLSTVRKSLVSEFSGNRRMEEPHYRHQQLSHSVPVAEHSTLQQLIACTTTAQSEIPLISAPTSIDVPRYSGVTAADVSRPEYALSSHLSLSSESLRNQYTYHHGALSPSRQHSMSSLQNSSIPESPNEQYLLRRASCPTDSVYGEELDMHHRSFSSSLSSSQEELNSTWPGPQGFASVEQCIAESPSMENGSWWGGEERARSNMEDTWMRNETDVSHQLDHQNNYHMPALRASSNGYGDDHRMRESSEAYNSMVFMRQPPSPLPDDGDVSGLGYNLKLEKSVPSPPESPGFCFSAQPTPTLGYPPTPALNQNFFAGMYASNEAPPVRSSIPPTPPSRPPSTSTGSAIAAVAAALAASTSKHCSKKSISRPGTSRRKASNSSMRSAAKMHSTASSVSCSMEEVSFVNFTPNDATRILSGVAPSGSSKTKARREREALEKRRKLSEAAAAAVIAAGGDASSLPMVDLL